MSVQIEKIIIKNSCVSTILIKLKHSPLFLPSSKFFHQGIKHFLYSASVGTSGKSLLIQSFSKQNNVTMVASNLGFDKTFEDSGIFTDGILSFNDNKFYIYIYIYKTKE